MRSRVEWEERKKGGRTIHRGSPATSPQVRKRTKQRNHKKKKTEMDTPLVDPPLFIPRPAQQPSNLPHSFDSKDAAEAPAETHAELVRPGEARFFEPLFFCSASSRASVIS
jgi:hypothetical protein